MSFEAALPIVRTKLYRPPVAGDAVTREDLLDRLRDGFHLPLTLVSAPAGYGKSTLISQWLAIHDGPSAWLSLDELDDDLRSFLTYVVAAVRTMFPEACQATFAVANGDELPLVPAVTRILTNDLEAVGERFVLALDDYHRLRDPAVHELVDGLLRYPLRSCHLVILGRRDPPLSLARLRAGNLVTEIRMQGLRFDRQTTAAFLERAAGLAVSGRTLSELHEKTEGWPVGLRLAALALRRRGDLEEFVRALGGGMLHLQDYLLHEVLAEEPPAVREWLAKISILDRFCAPLCETVCGPGAGFFPRLSGDAGLLCIALDERGEWYRYHHLFQGLLQRQLREQASAGEIAALHRRAAGWFAANAFIEEALRHALEGGDKAGAARLVAENGNRAINKEQWVRLARWLDIIGDEIVESDPELLLLRAWLTEYHYAFEKAWEDAARAESLLAGLPQDSPVRRRLAGEIEALRSQQRYCANDAGKALACAERALALLPPDAQSTRGFAVVLRAGSLQMRGDLGKAYEVLDRARRDSSRAGPVFLARAGISLCWTHWMAGDLSGAAQTAAWLLRHGEENNQQETADFGRYFLGICRYELDDPAEAERLLAPLVEEPYATRTVILAHGAFALASCRMAQGRIREAQELIDALAGRIEETGSAFVLPVVRAFRAEIALRRGCVAEALQHLRGVPFEPLTPFYLFYEPRMTLVRVLIAERTAESLGRAGEALERLSAHVRLTHNTRFLIEVRTLEALRYAAMGREEAALEALEEAVRLAEPGGFVRLFADQGPELAGLLNRLDLDEPRLRYAGRILAAFRGGAPRSPAAEAPARAVAVDPLSRREREILALLADRLTNREIADRLHISVVTVKRHAANIYDKLGVHGRRQAVAKASGLGIIR